MPAPSSSLGFYPELDGDVTEADLLAFLADRLEENHVLEYKETWNAPKAVPGVAAFANRHGGYLILGVGEEKLPSGRAIPHTHPTPMPADTAAKFRNSCFQKLDPPWVPDIVTVNIGTDDKVVLVVRVPPMPKLRPISHDGAVYLRYGDQTRTAPREEIRRLFLDPGNDEPTYFANPASFVGPQGFGIELTGRWFVVRGVATAELPPGLDLRPIAGDLRTTLNATVRDGPGDEWFTTQASTWACDILPWDVSGETHSAQYGLQRGALLPHTQDDAVHVRVLLGAQKPPTRNPGFWCLTDLSYSSVNRINDLTVGEDRARMTDIRPQLIGFATLTEMLAAALDQADQVLKVLVEAHEPPRPHHSHFAGGLIGGLTDHVDIASLGRFTRNINEGADNVMLTEPTTYVPLGELDATRAAAEYLERMLLDRGLVTTP